METLQYRPSRRSWIKLWTHEWLTGTVRWQLTGSERSIFTDLLCLAGMSRFPGIVASGYEGDENSPLMGYPLSWLAAQCGADPATMGKTLEKLQMQKRITFTGNDDLLVVTIVSWEKYQSEYMTKRQRRRYKEAPRSDSAYKRHRKSAKCPPKCPTEEVEGEVDVEKTKPTLTPFAVFWVRYPRKDSKKSAARAFQRLKAEEIPVLMEALEKFKLTDSWNRDGGQYVPYAATFLNDRRWEDELGQSDQSFEHRAARAAAKEY